MNLPALYELAAEFKEAGTKLLDMGLDEQTIADTLEGLQGTLEIKATNVAAVIRNTEAVAEAIEAAVKQMQERAKAMKNRADSLRLYLKHNMELTGISKIENPHFVLSIQSNPPKVVIDADSLIPADYLRYPEMPPPEIDKKKIAADIKAGVEVPGAHLESTNRLVIK